MQKIVVIGAGPAGYPAALKAAALGAAVTLVEKKALGGVCLNCGCIPSKSFLHDAHRLAALNDLGGLTSDGGGELGARLFALRDFEKIKARQRLITQKLAGGISMLLKKAGVRVVLGEASFAGAHEIRVTAADGSNEVLPADGVIIAAGTQAFFPPPFDRVKAKIYDNSTLFNMPRLPESLAIAGGGVIGCEMADCFAALGVKVTLIEMQPRLLPAEDEAAARVVAQALAKRGVSVRTGVSATDIKEENGGWELTLSDGTQVHAQDVLAAIGRTADLSALHLENIGINWTRKGVSVHPQTLQLKDHIYAAGDITGLCQLAHAATRQGEVAASNLCGVRAVYDNSSVPHAVYTSPELAAVGLTRKQAEAQGLPVKTQKAFLAANGRAAAQDQTQGYYELISHAQTGALLGAVFVGAQAAELIHVAAVALAAKLTAAQLGEVIFAHPTLAETVGEAARK